ncbi:hypothetical protein A0H81_03782 [Grifola frondosa]|uniref:DUF6532 domain-containing protein n=1 Tax=Grifola frondosa TaxID=5627 RepID=A0A1C7MHU5_GRIFR|nr:hypothetical protein A0H81_03782 [Grifola frondosa]
MHTLPPQQAMPLMPDHSVLDDEDSAALALRTSSVVHGPPVEMVSDMNTVRDMQLSNQKLPSSSDMIISTPVEIPPILKRTKNGLVHRVPSTPRTPSTRSTAARGPLIRHAGILRSASQHVGIPKTPTPTGPLQISDLQTSNTSTSSALHFFSSPSLPGQENIPPVIINDDVDDVHEEFECDNDAEPIPARKKPKKSRSARTLEAQRAAVVVAAYPHFKLLLCTTNPWASAQDLDTLIMDAFAVACEEKGVELLPQPEDCNVIRQRASQIRSTFKTAARDFVQDQYGFKSGNSDDIQAQNRALVALLTEKTAFAHMDPQDRTTLCRNPIIEKVLTKVWFTDEGSDGVRYPEYFDLVIPLPMLAFVLTAVECAIHEWKEGTRSLVEMRMKPYKKYYENHLKMLTGWETYSATRSQACRRLQEDLLQTLRANAGVAVIAIQMAGEPTFTDEDFAANEL